MFHDEQNLRATQEECYSVAVGSSNLRHDPVRPGAVQMLIAAGISPHSLGTALMRLRTEWDSTAKPMPATVEQLRAIAATFQREGNGLVIVEKVGDSEALEEVTPMVAATRQADGWYAGELARLLGRLKSLPIVRGELLRWTAAEGIEGGPHVVAAVLLWWLNGACPVCKGVRKKVVEGTGRTSSKNCSKCRGLGESQVPHGFLGRKVLGYIRHCQSNAAKHLRDIRWRHQLTSR
jgi:hypothetical protein